MRSMPDAIWDASSKDVSTVGMTAPAWRNGRRLIPFPVSSPPDAAIIVITGGIDSEVIVRAMSVTARMARTFVRAAGICAATSHSGFCVVSYARCAWATMSPPDRWMPSTSPLAAAWTSSFDCATAPSRSSRTWMTCHTKTPAATARARSTTVRGPPMSATTTEVFRRQRWGVVSAPACRANGCFEVSPSTPRRARCVRLPVRRVARVSAPVCKITGES